MTAPLHAGRRAGLLRAAEFDVLSAVVTAKSFTRVSLRKHVGVAVQDSLVFNESILANVACGRPGASRHDLEAAAPAANAHGFISRLPHGVEEQARGLLPMAA